MAMVDWYVEGVSFGNCNCRYGCPCQFEDLPSQGHCHGFEVMDLARSLVRQVHTLARAPACTQQSIAIADLSLCRGIMD